MLNCCTNRRHCNEGASQWRCRCFCLHDGQLTFPAGAATSRRFRWTNRDKALSVRNDQHQSRPTSHGSDCQCPEAVAKQEGWQPRREAERRAQVAGKPHTCTDRTSTFRVRSTSCSQSSSWSYTGRHFLVYLQQVSGSKLLYFDFFFLQNSTVISDLCSDLALCHVCRTVVLFITKTVYLNHCIYSVHATFW